MSIHHYSKLLREKFKGERYLIPDEEANSIVASGINGKKPHLLKVEDYTEDLLMELTIGKDAQKKRGKKFYIDYRFWNYKWCKPDNLKIDNLTHLRNPPDGVLIDPNLFYVGCVVVMIMYYQVLYYTYLIENESLFEVYLTQINIDRNDFSRFMITKKIYLPLTKNYLKLLERIFHNDNIPDYLLDQSCIYTRNEIRAIFENSTFEVKDIRYYTRLIFERDDTQEEKLLNLDLFLDLYDGDIDHYETVYLAPGMEDKPVGYYLNPEEIPDDLFNLYTQIMEKYYFKNGALEVISI